MDIEQRRGVHPSWRSPVVAIARRGDRPSWRSPVVQAGAVIRPCEVAEHAVAAGRDGRFLVLPHPGVRDMLAGKVADHDRCSPGCAATSGRCDSDLCSRLSGCVTLAEQ